MSENLLLTRPWRLYPGIWNVNSALIDWREIDGSSGNFMKVLVVDEDNFRVDFLFRQEPWKQFARHRHLCAVATLTLEGEWGYREGDEKLFEGCFAYETAGTTHTPYATGNGMTIYASFQGKGPVFNEILDDDGRVIGQVDIDFFKAYYEADARSA